MKASDLKQHEQTLINALRHAAEVYVQDANNLTEQPRVAAQFVKQAQEANALAGKLEEEGIQ